MSTPILKAVKKYIDKDMSRLHMPGHKGVWQEPFGDVMKYDVTEVKGTDSLYSADECIAQTEKEFSRLYDTKKTLISAGGSSLCIQTMLKLVAKDGGKIICGRNIHVSAVNAMSLLNLDPVWLYTNENTGLGLGGAIEPCKVKKALSENKDAIAVYITSPNYFGIMADIKSISEICKKYNVPLLVDNAHGACLKFYEKDIHPITLGADMCCDSLHKTMPVLTGGALLHINNEKYIGDAKRAMSIFGSTSPSYLIMISCDTAIDYIKNRCRKDIKEVCGTVKRLKDMATKKGFDLPKGIIDTARLTLILDTSGYTAQSFRKHLDKYNIEPEYISDSGCVFLVSAFNSEKDIKRLEDAINYANIIKTKANENKIIKPIKVLTLRQAMFSQKKIVDTKNSCGEIAGEIIAPCPPGIPVVMNGERITDDMSKILFMYGVKQITVIK